MENELLSIVIPVYKSQDIVEKTVRTIIKFLSEKGYNFEILLVNDGSPDDSWKVISRLAKNDSRVTAINLLKNYGQHTAVFCGIMMAKGEFIITMDDDLQNPPEEIPKLTEKIISGGHDLVFARFRRKNHGYFRGIGSKVIGYLNYKIFNKPKHITLTNFRIFTRDVVERMRQYRTSYPYIPGLLLMFASNIGNVEAEHKAREVGKSNYTIWVILRLVSRILFNYSSYPLKLLTQIGFTISFLSFLAGAFYLMKAILVGSSVQGFPTLTVLISFINGFIIIMLGVLGEYMVRMLNQISSNQSYHIKDIIRNE